MIWIALIVGLILCIPGVFKRAFGVVLAVAAVIVWVYFVADLAPRITSSEMIQNLMVLVGASLTFGSVLGAYIGLTRRRH